MIQHNNHLFVEVPEGSRSIKIDNDMGQKVIWKEGKYGASDEWIYEKLPAGTWQILGLAKDLTEEQWEQICDFYTEDAEGQITHWTQWRNYKHKDWFDLLTATESARSLISSLGLEFGRVVVLKCKN